MLSSILVVMSLQHRQYAMTFLSSHQGEFLPFFSLCPVFELVHFYSGCLNMHIYVYMNISIKYADHKGPIQL